MGVIELGVLAGALASIAGFGALVIKILNRALKPIRELKSEIDMIKTEVDLINSALRAVLKNSITRTHREFSAEGKIGRYALESSLDMYEEYKKLGGNSFVDKIAAELRKIPLDTGEGR